MDTLAAYIPTDRLHALARGEELPDRASGAALFADISGFTPLTEALVRVLGPRRGAEELTRQLNEVYDALIAEVDRYGGSVIGFAGDAITCWFDGDTGPRATACALMMQRAMARFGGVALPSGGLVTLALKAAVASGPARRFVVGDPAIQRIEVLAGAALDQVAILEHMARRADVVLSPECLRALGESALVVEWYAGPTGRTHYPVIGGLMAPVEATPWPPLAPGTLGEEQLRPWLPPAVYARLQAGQGELLPELRSAVALFLRFDGIAYEDDQAAESKLDHYIRWVQSVLARYEGTLIQLSIGDKGSYLYAAFGVPIAHEDDPRRAVTAALELRMPPPELRFIRATQIGLSQGTMRAGAYGGATRRTYGALGDTANLAARLMLSAPPGEVLATRRVQQNVADAFAWEELPSIQVKGKRQSIALARLVGVRVSPVGAIGYAGPLIGRAEELAQIRQAIEPIFAGRFAGLVSIYGEAGMGKSRLVYELRQALAPQALTPVAARLPLSRRDGRGGWGVRAAWFTCPAEGMRRQSLQPFRSFLRAYFDQDADRSEAENRERFDTILAELIAFLATNDQRPTTNDQRHTFPSSGELGAELERARFFLAALVDLRWPGSPYEKVEPHLRFEKTLAAFRTLIVAESLRRPVIVQIEDAHWLDDDSRELIRVLTRDAAVYPFAVLLASRYNDDGSPLSMPLDADIPRQDVHLRALSPDGIRALAAHVLGDPIADELTAFLAEKTNGNPFFVEQLALDLRERGLLSAHSVEGRAPARREKSLAPFVSFDRQRRADEVPASITAVLIARLDRLAAPVKEVVQTAAVLGQEFDVQVLARMLPDDAEALAKVRHAEAEAIWSAAGETRYRFRHSLLRDAAHDMQVHARLRQLHARAGAAIEQVYGEALADQIANLAYHYGQAEDADRERQYLALLGEQAFHVSAFREAIACFERALTLTPEDGTRRARLTYQLGRIYLLLNQHNQAQQLYEQSLALSEAAGDQVGVAAAYFELATIAAQRSAHTQALKYLERSLALYQSTSDQAGQGRVLNRLGGLYIELGEEEQALACYEQALSLGRSNGPRRR